MDVGAFTKGDKGRGRGAGKGTQDQTCHNCGDEAISRKIVRTWWRSTLAGFSCQGQTQIERAGQRSERSNQRQKRLSMLFEDDDEEEYHDEEEQEQPDNEEGLVHFLCAL